MIATTTAFDTTVGMNDYYRRVTDSAKGVFLYAVKNKCESLIDDISRLLAPFPNRFQLELNQFASNPSYESLGENGRRSYNTHIQMEKDALEEGYENNWLVSSAVMLESSSNESE